VTFQLYGDSFSWALAANGAARVRAAAMARQARACFMGVSEGGGGGKGERATGARQARFTNF